MMYFVTNRAADWAGNGADGDDSEQSRVPASIRRILAKLFVRNESAAPSLDDLASNRWRELDRKEKTAVREQILASTIQIKMIEKGQTANDTIDVRVENGLGTLVERDGQRFVMTHNQWATPEADLARVEIRDASGSLLAILDGMTFLSLVRYRDAGTLLLAAPAELKGMKPASPCDRISLAAGERLWIVSHSGQPGSGLDIIEADVDQPGSRNLPAQLLLRDRETAVAPGDSGGGVWHKGKLVGNMWAIVNSPQVTPMAWQGWFSSPGNVRPARGYIVAERPLAGQLAAVQFKKSTMRMSGLLP